MRRKNTFWKELSDYERRQVLNVAWRKLVAGEVVDPSDREDFIALVDEPWSEIHPAVRQVIEDTFRAMLKA